MQIDYSQITTPNLRSKSYLYNGNSTTFKGYAYRPKKKIDFNELNPVNRYVNKLFERSLVASSKRIQEVIPELSKFTKEVKTKNSYLWDINPDSRKKYVIIMHGTSQNITNLQSLYKGIVEKTNYAVLAPEYQGFGKNHKCTISKKSISQDMDSALNYLKEKKINPKDVTLIGHSFGGFAASELAKKNDNLERLILVSSVKTLEHETVRINNIKKEKIPPLVSFLFKNFKCFRKSLASVLQTEKNIKKTNIPVTIIHSKNDRLIDYSVAHDLSKKCKKPDGVYILETGGHGMNSSKIETITSILSGNTPDKNITHLDVSV